MPLWLRRWLRGFVLIIAALLAAMAVFGTPHIGWDYGCRHPMRSGEGCKAYAWCEYYGFQGRRVLRGDQCGHLVWLVPVDWEKMFGTGGEQDV